MKRIYLIRHTKPELGGREHVCLGGRSDPPLSTEGFEAAKKLALCFSDGEKLRIYASPLLRAQQTAEALSAGRWPVETLPGVREIDTGEWDGLSFDVIRERYPELYALRGGDLSLTPPGGESLEKCAERGMKALRSVMDDGDETAVIVAHAGMIRSLLCVIMGRPLGEYRSIARSYGCINSLLWDGEKLLAEAVGRAWDALPDAEEMYARFAAPPQVRDHCGAVKKTALALAAALPESRGMDIPLLESAALLHDMCRSEKHHAERAAERLRDEGYLRLANVIEKHHDCPVVGEIDEAKLLFLADKLCFDTEIIGIKERFDRSFKRCENAEARAAHERRRAMAEEIEKKYLKAAGISAIEEAIK